MVSEMRSAPAPICCSPSARRPGRICSPGPCSPSNCSAPPASLPITPIIAKDREMRALFPLTLIAIVVAIAGAAQASRGSDAEALAEARREAAEAAQHYQALDQEARHATGEADRARAASEALAARIEAAEADLTMAERRISLIAALQADQRARLAERQGPIVRLTAALETMTRRPAALALVQPGSVRDAVHVRTLLAAALPEIRRRTVALRREVQRGASLRSQSEMARRIVI